MFHRIEDCVRYNSCVASNGNPIYISGYTTSILPSMIVRDRLPTPKKGGETKRRDPFLPREARDVRPLSSSAGSLDGTKESGVLCAVRLASADDSPRVLFLSPMNKLYIG